MSWRTWSYREWNQHLLTYCLGAIKGKTYPVGRILASPEELAQVVGDREASPEDIAAGFVIEIGKTIPTGTSFKTFCENYRGWHPEADNPPHFFAMLWFTCLIAHGYPDGADGFHVRMERVLGKTQRAAMTCLPGLWHNLAAWSTRQARLDDIVYRSLVLPEPCTFRTNIGESWFLAFPHRDDEDRLEQVLSDRDLLGDELPILGVLAALKEERRFSRSFREDLSNFEQEFLGGARDLRASPFWVAVQQAALRESDGEAEQVHPTLLAWHDDKLLPYIACRADTPLPAGYTAVELREVVRGWTHFVLSPGKGGVPERMTNAALAALAGDLEVTPSIRRQIRRGVLIFQEAGTWDEFEPVVGSLVAGAERALVKDDLLEAFVEVFGGRQRPYVEGWREVVGCRVELQLDLPKELRRVYHLQETSSVPTVRLVGGVLTSGGYYALPDFLPRVRVPEAESVVVHVGGETIPIDTNSSVGAGDLILPNDLVEHIDTPMVVWVRYRLPSGQTREGSAELHLVGHQLAHNYKGLPPGTFTGEGGTSYRDVVVPQEPLPSLPTPMPGGLELPELPAAEVAETSSPPSRIQSVIDALSALGVRRSGLRFREVLDVLEVAIQPDRGNPTKRRLHHDLARALVEAGTFDLVRRQGWPVTLLLPRPPRLVAQLRGDELQVSLLGLAPSVLVERCLDFAEGAGAEVALALSGHVRVPAIPHFRTTDIDLIDRLTEQFRLAPVEWAEQPRLAPFDGLSSLRSDPLPDEYLFDECYDFASGRFVRGRSRAGPDEVAVERSHHPRHHPAFALVRGDEDVGWTRRRDLALLAARVANAGTIPYRFERGGVLIRTDPSGPTLPLAFGRLCTVFGSGPPGPTAGWTWGYAYPFGPDLEPWVESLLPLEPHAT